MADAATARPPTAQAVQDASGAPAVPTAAEPGPDLAVPGASELQDMFPELDEAVIRETLEAHNGNVEASVGSLLGMTDPHAKPELDTAGDEALARQMALEPEQANVLTPTDTVGASASVPYQPQTADPAVTSTSSGRDELQKLQDDFQRLAGVGKKTVAGWLSSARAKYQDMQQPRPELQGDTAATSAPPGAAPPRPSSGSPQAVPAGPDQRRSSRITQPLPHASRYDTPSTAPAPPREPAPVSKPALNPAAAQPGAVGAAGDEDAEDLEFVRNPFEDED